MGGGSAEFLNRFELNQGIQVIVESDQSQSFEITCDSKIMVHVDSDASNGYLADEDDAIQIFYGRDSGSESVGLFSGIIEYEGLAQVPDISITSGVMAIKQATESTKNGVDKMGLRINSMENEINAIKSKVNKMDGIDNKMNTMDGKLSTLEDKMSTMDSKLSTIEAMLAQLLEQNKK